MTKILKRSVLLFWSKVNVTDDPWDCWEWKAFKDKYGYGQFSHELAHRIAFELSRGRPVEKELHVLHMCDNRPCCNPCHLIEGTNDDNVADMVRKGRALRTLTPQQIALGRKMYEEGSSYNAIGKMLGVGAGHIRHHIKKVTEAG